MIVFAKYVKGVSKLSYAIEREGGFILEAKTTYGINPDQNVYIRTEQTVTKMSYAEFCAVAMYVLTNAELEENDPRLDFVRQVNNLRIVDGYRGSSGKRLEIVKLAGEIP